MTVSGAFNDTLSFQGGDCGGINGTAYGNMSGPNWAMQFLANGELKWFVQTTPSDTFDGQPIWTVAGSGASKRIDFAGTVRDQSGHTVTFSGGGLCSDLHLQP